MKTFPNILYLHSHDTGRYISPYGHKVNTPNLQNFAEESIVFRECFCANPTCSPSRACLLTGEYAHSNGMLGLAHRGFDMNDYKKHIIHKLREHGYYSALLGIQHIIAKERENEIGYDEVIDRSSINESCKINDMAQIADDFFSRKHTNPFFLSIGCFETHRKFPENDSKNDPRWVKPPAILPDNEQNRLDMARFNTMAETYDEGVGKILQSLDDNGLAQNTLVIITTDHGIAFPEMKCNLTSHGLGVLLMMRGPGDFEGCKVLDGMVSHVDIYPTLCEYLGVEAPQRLQGTSFMPMVRGEKDKIRSEVFSEVNAHAAYEPMRSVRTERYSYIKRLLKGHTTTIMPNCDEGLSRDLWINYNWNSREYSREELYDLIYDPMERNNLADSPEMATVLEDMRSKLGKWMQETNDPVLKYQRPPLPETAVLNDVDDLVPSKGEILINNDFREKNEIPKA